ncbi:MFS general substrate transporter [Mycena galericulata]|nr:MFS general substrate transporter [Mycena galericulata]
MDDSQEERERSVGKDTRTETSTSAVGPALPQTDLDLVPPAFPEGGARAWATVAGTFLVQFCGFGYTTSFGVYQDFYTRDYLTHSSSSAISWIGSVNALLVISGGLFAGRLYDRGHFYALLYGGATLQCFSLFMLSVCKPEQFYQIFLAQGLGAGTVYVPSVAVVSHYFQKRRALLAMIVVPRRGRAPHHAEHHARFGVIWVLGRRCPSTTYVGFYFPLFYLQLDAVKHGIDETFSFYSLVIMNASSFMVVLAAGCGCGAVLILSMIALKTIASQRSGDWGVVDFGLVTLMAPLVAALTQDMGELGYAIPLYIQTPHGRLLRVMGLGGLVAKVRRPPDGRIHLVAPGAFSGLMAFIGFAFFVATLGAVRRLRGDVGKVRVPVEIANENENENADENENEGKKEEDEEEAGEEE